jgi:transposase-like protein
MGLSSSEQELKKIAAFIEELELRNTRPLDLDWLALFFDGKYVEISGHSMSKRLLGET